MDLIVFVIRARGDSESFDCAGIDSDLEFSCLCHLRVVGEGDFDLDLMRSNISVIG